MRKAVMIFLAGVLLLGLAGCKEETPKLQLDPSAMTEEGTESTLGEHSHQVAEEPQTVEDPVSGYCGNTQTTLHIGEKEYTFMYGNSVALTDILINLNYDPVKVCRCLPEYTVDTEFGKGYGVNLTEGYARCEKGQADLTREQIERIAEIISWAETTNGKYPIDDLLQSP